MNDLNRTIREPVVFSRDGQTFANSRDVAAFFEKRHDDVLKAIGKLLTAAPEALRSFAEGSYTLPATGSQQHRCFDMDRDGFSLLAMGFTGPKALAWKLKYIAAFNGMEAELRRVANSGPLIDLNEPGALRSLLLTYAEKAIALERQVDDLLPSAKALERISEADGSLCVTDAAKALQMRPTDLFTWLRQNGWTYRRPGTANDLGYQSKTTAGLLEHKVTTVLRADGSEKIIEQVRVTPRGLAKLATLVKPAIRAA